MMDQTLNKIYNIRKNYAFQTHAYNASDLIPLKITVMGLLFTKSYLASSVSVSSFVHCCNFPPHNGAIFVVIFAVRCPKLKRQTMILLPVLAVTWSWVFPPGTSFTMFLCSFYSL